MLIYFSNYILENETYMGAAKNWGLEPLKKKKSGFYLRIQIFYFWKFWIFSQNFDFNFRIQIFSLRFVMLVSELLLFSPSKFRLFFLRMLNLNSELWL